MTSSPTLARLIEERAEPAWDVATLFPAQGAWSEEDYLVLPTNHLVEFSHGAVHVLPMPSQTHQLIVLFLYRLLYQFVSSHNLGTLLIAPLRIRLWPGKFREPNLVFMLADHDMRRHETYWEGADLVVEVVSPDDPRRDLVTKRQEYAQAGIPEYWIVDPKINTSQSYNWKTWPMWSMGSLDGVRRPIQYYLQDSEFRSTMCLKQGDHAYSLHQFNTSHYEMTC